MSTTFGVMNAEKKKTNPKNQIGEIFHSKRKVA